MQSSLCLPPKKPLQSSHWMYLDRCTARQVHCGIIQRRLDLTCLRKTITAASHSCCYSPCPLCRSSIHRRLDCERIDTAWIVQGLCTAASSTWSTMSTSLEFLRGWQPRRPTAASIPLNETHSFIEMDAIVKCLFILFSGIEVLRRAAAHFWRRFRVVRLCRIVGW